MKINRQITCSLIFVVFLVTVTGIVAGEAPYAYITNYDSNKLSVIDTANDTVVATVNAGSDPTEVIVNPTGTKVYITNYYTNKVSVIDTSTNMITSIVNVENHPHGIAISPDGTKVYVANVGSKNVSIIDTATNTITATVNVGSSPSDVAVNPTGTKVYITNYYTNKVSVIDTSTNTVTAAVNVGSYPNGIAVSPDGTKVYVANRGSNTISVIDTSTNKVTASINVGSGQCGIAVNPIGTKMYVTNPYSNKVSIIDTTNNTVIAFVNAVYSPYRVAVNPAGTKVYVANGGSKNVSIIDTATNTVTNTVNVGSYAFGVAIAPALKPVNAPPTTNPVSVTNTESLTPTISWTYYDTEGNPQRQYELEVWTGSGGTGTNLWTTAQSSVYTSVTYAGASLVGGNTYYVRVKAFDGSNWGEWSETSFISLTPADLSKDIKVTDVSVDDGSNIIQLGDTVNVVTTFQNLRSPLNSEDFLLHVRFLAFGKTLLLYDFDVKDITAASGETKKGSVQITLPADNEYLLIDSVEAELIPVNYVDTDPSNNKAIKKYFITVLTNKELWEHLNTLMLEAVGNAGVPVDDLDTAMAADEELNKLRGESLIESGNPIDAVDMYTKFFSRVVELSANMLDSDTGPDVKLKLMTNLWIAYINGLIDVGKSLGFGLIQTFNILRFSFNTALIENGVELNAVFLKLECPVDIEIIDENQNIAGVVNNQIINNIKDCYVMTDGDTKNLVMYNDSYKGCKIKLRGTANGEFNFSIFDPKYPNYISYRNVPVNANTVCSLDTKNSNLLMSVDSNSDGIIDQIIEPTIVSLEDSLIPPQSIRDVQSLTGSTWINWTWINPTDSNFNHTEIYLNNIFQENTPAEFFNATGLEPEKEYTLSTRTVDISGNVNETWVNSTVTTLAELASDTEKPIIQLVVLFPTNTTAGSTINVTVTATDNIDVTGVTADDIQLIKTDGIWQGSITAPSSVGDYSLLITAKDATGNTAEITKNYKVVTPTGSLGVGVSPKTTTAPTSGKTIDYTVKIKSIQNFDDIVRVNVTMDGLPASYQIPLDLFEWNNQTINIPSNSTVSLPLKLTIPSGQTAGRKAFKVRANSTLWITSAYDSGVITIS